MKSRILVALAALTTLLVATAPAQAHHPWQGKQSRFLDRIDLPNGYQPEGIASGRGSTFYVGSIPTGEVRVGDFRVNETKPLVPPQAGRAAIGLKYKHGQLFVAGGATGKAFVYNAATGADVKTFDLATGSDPTFINDVAIARGTAWFTDSRRPVLYAVDTKLGSARTVTLSGIPFGAGNNLNGIVAAQDRGFHGFKFGHHKRGHKARASHFGKRHGGLRLLSVQTNTGALWNINPTTGAGTQVDLGGATLANGDGMLLAGRVLFVVQNRLNQIAVVHLSRDLLRGRVVATIKRDGFAVPTTIAASGRHLYAVNARFGTPPGPDVPYWITKVF